MTVPHGDEQFQIYHWYGAGRSMHKASWVGQADTLECAEELARALYGHRMTPKSGHLAVIVEPVCDRVFIVDQARHKVVSGFMIR